MKSRLILVSLSLGLLAACATTPVPDVRRDGDMAASGTAVQGAQTSPLGSAEPPESGVFGLAAPRPSRYDGCVRGCSSMVEPQLPKLMTRVRFPSPAPIIP